MSFLKNSYTIVCLLILILAFSGCNWGPAETDNNSKTNESAAVSVASESSVTLENFRELAVSSDGLVAGSYDGKLAWSPDGNLLAIGMSNQTLASTQTQLLDVTTGRRMAVIGGYNIRWDETDPDRLVFSRHQYYGPPDYGSFEEVIAVSQAELLRQEVFNEDMNYEVLAEGEIETNSLPENVWQSAPWANRQIQVRVEDGSANIYIVSSEEKFLPLLDGNKHYNGFALDPFGEKILIREVAGTADEFGNLDATDSNTKFLIADIIENN